MYNSAVFSSLCSRRYNVYLVSSEFLDGAPFNLSSTWPSASWTMSDRVQDLANATNILQDYQKNQTSLVKLENKACVEVYTAPTISTNSDLIAVSTYSDPTNSLLFYDLGQDSQLVMTSYASGYCSLPFLSNCDPSGVTASDQNWSMIWPEAVGSGVDGGQDDRNGTLSIQYCLSKRVEEHCKLQFSLAIMIAVIICNLIKTICMSIIAWKQDPEPLVTLGDAIASFLDRPDVMTEGNCIAGRTRFEDSKSWGLCLSRWHPKRLRWFRAASKRRWLVCNIL